MIYSTSEHQNIPYVLPMGHIGYKVGPLPLPFHLKVPGLVDNPSKNQTAIV